MRIPRYLVITNGQTQFDQFVRSNNFDKRNFVFVDSYEKLQSNHFAYVLFGEFWLNPIYDYIESDINHEEILLEEVLAQYADEDN